MDDWLNWERWKLNHLSVACLSAPLQQQPFKGTGFQWISVDFSGFQWNDSKVSIKWRKDAAAIKERILLSGNSRKIWTSDMDGFFLVNLFQSRTIKLSKLQQFIVWLKPALCHI